MHKRSLEQQKARLLAQSQPRPKKAGYSTKYVKKELIKQQYGLKPAPVQAFEPPFIPMIISVIIAIAVFLISNFAIAIFSAMVSFVISFISTEKIKKKPKVFIKNRMPYNMNMIFENYSDCFNPQLKDRLLDLKQKLEKLNPDKLELSSHHYIESTLQKDLPDIFSNYYILWKNKSPSHHELALEIISKIELISNKIDTILENEDNLLGDNIKVKAKVIENKANIY